MAAGLTRLGDRIATIDLLIASVALDNDVALLTRHQRRFARLPDLEVLAY